jgi:hypothetical protein
MAKGCGSSGNDDLAENLTRGARNVRVLSLLTIVRIFFHVPMDSIVSPLRIERLNLPKGQQIQVSMDAAPWEAARNEYAWGVSALPRGSQGLDKAVQLRRH